MNFAKETRTTVIPGMRYRDCPAAIEWLCKTLGFEKHAVYMNKDGTVAHAQLTFGNGMVMMGSVMPNSPANSFTKQPDEIGGCETQAACLIVSDADAVYASAKSNGAQMISEIADMHYGGRAFSCRDPEGHIWNIGSWDPWTAENP